MTKSTGGPFMNQVSGLISLDSVEFYVIIESATKLPICNEYNFYRPGFNRVQGKIRFCSSVQPLKFLSVWWVVIDFAKTLLLLHF